MTTANFKSEAALEVVGPSAFGYDAEFRPLPGGVIGLPSYPNLKQMKKDF